MIDSGLRARNSPSAQSLQPHPIGKSSLASSALPASEMQDVDGSTAEPTSYDDAETEPEGCLDVITLKSSGSATITELLQTAPHAFGTRIGIVLCLGNACDALETLSGGFVSLQLEKEFSGIETLMAAVFVGMFVGGCCAGSAACRYGPTRVLVWMLSLECVSAFGGSTSQSGLQFAFWRFLSGFSVGAAVPSLFTTANELIHPVVRRNRWLNLIASSFMIGSITDALLAYIMEKRLALPWRYFYAATGLLPLIAALLTYAWIPESPNFLLHKGSRAQLHQELRKLGEHWSSTQGSIAFHVSPDTQFETERILAKEEQCGVPNLSSLLRGDWRGSLQRLAIVCFSIAFAWYGLSTWLLIIFEQVGVKDPYLAAVAFSLSGLPGCLVCISLIAWVQPVVLLGSALISTSVTSLALSVMLRGSSKLPPLAAVATVCIFNSMSTGVFNVLTTVWACPFPLELQPLAVGFLSVAMRIGSIAAQFVDGTMMEHGEGFLMVLITSILLALSALATVGVRSSDWSHTSATTEGV